MQTTDHAHHISTFEDAHEWSKDNMFIQRGYRKNFRSAKQILKSLFMKHNELMNVWTHAIGAFIFLLLLVYVLANVERTKLIYDQLKEDLLHLNLSSSFDTHLNKAVEILADNWHEMEFDLQGKVLKGMNSFGNMTEGFKNYSKEVYDNLVLKENQLVTDMSQSYEQMEENFRIFTASIVSKLSGLVDDPNAFLPQVRQALTNQKVKELLGTTSSLEVWPISVFLLSAFTCLFCSAVFHLFCDMNPYLCNKLKNFDYAGISVLISGSSFAIMYYSFYCRTGTLIFYSIMIFTFSMIVFFISLGSYIHKQENVTKKAFLYGGLGLSNVFPLFHMVALFVFKSKGDLPVNSSIFWVMLSGVVYLLGLAIYSSKFPEKYYPKKFDIWLNSHVIWHCFVFLGAFLHFVGVNQSFKLREITTCPLQR